MTAKPHDIHGTKVLIYTADGAKLRSDQDTRDVIGEALSHDAQVIVLPVGRLDPDFFKLRTRVAGEMLQKFVNYRFRVAIVGDVTAQVAQSDALRDFVRESNQGDSVWFLPDIDALKARLA
jgi:hypothetical protein